MVVSGTSKCAIMQWTHWHYSSIVQDINSLLWFFALSAIVTQSGLCFKVHVLEYCDHLVQSVYLRMKPMPLVLLLGSVWLILSSLIVACLVTMSFLKAISVQLCILDVTSFCVCCYEIQCNRSLLLWISVWGRNPTKSVLASIEISFLVFQVIWNK